MAILTESREAMSFRNHCKYWHKCRNCCCTCILIVATVRRQPISLASGNVPDLPALSDFTGLAYRWYQRHDCGNLPDIRIKLIRSCRPGPQ
jgi:hypothetical protein